MSKLNAILITIVLVIISFACVPAIDNNAINFKQEDPETGISVEVTGNSSFDYGLINNRYGGELNGRIQHGKEAVDQLELTFHCTAFGIIGEAGIIKVYDKEIIPATSLIDRCQISKRQKFTGTMLIAFVNPVVRIESGSDVIEMKGTAGFFDANTLVFYNPVYLSVTIILIMHFIYRKFGRNKVL